MCVYVSACGCVAWQASDENKLWRTRVGEWVKGWTEEESGWDSTPFFERVFVCLTDPECIFFFIFCSHLLST